MKIKPATPEAYQLFHEGLLALSQIEANGIRIDLAYLKEVSANTDREIRRLEGELREMPEFSIWRKRFGEKTKLGAHVQLGTVVFDLLGHKRGRAKKVKDEETHEKSLRDANDQSAFEHLDIPFVDKWFEWQKLNKLRSPYIRNMEDEVESEFMHPIYDLHRAVTYRSSSSKPNFQNYPTRNPVTSKLIRSAVIARDGHVLVENDFKGIEVNVGACYHKDSVMLDYLAKGYDYHKEYAAKCYRIKPDVVSKDARYCAKNRFVFPEFYGSYYIDCAPNLWEACTIMDLMVGDKPLIDHLNKLFPKGLGDCDSDRDPVKGTFEYHIKQVQLELWDLFKGYAEWKESFYRQYRRRGWFELYTGFVCSGLYARNDVTNYPIQGAAFHCLLWVLTQLQKKLRKYKMKSKLVGQIHDSMLGDVLVKELENYLEIVKHLVEVELRKRFPWIIVKMEIEAEIAPEGKSWFHKKQVPL